MKPETFVFLILCCTLITLIVFWIKKSKQKPMNVEQLQHLVELTLRDVSPNFKTTFVNHIYLTAFFTDRNVVYEIQTLMEKAHQGAPQFINYLKSKLED